MTRSLVLLLHLGSCVAVRETRPTFTVIPNAYPFRVESMKTLTSDRCNVVVIDLENFGVDIDDGVKATIFSHVDDPNCPCSEGGLAVRDDNGWTVKRWAPAASKGRVVEHGSNSRRIELQAGATWLQVKAPPVGDQFFDDSAICAYIQQRRPATDSISRPYASTSSRVADEH